MLVITRRSGESFSFQFEHLDPNLTIRELFGEEMAMRVRLLQIDGRQVRIGIEAPQEITILRAELEDGYRDRRAAVAR
ncbi:MAG: carbon storage regulator [gamma proteobacterium endosymbiont of Lamellibrachia anaximandri]|nr:carbon storage regulator [gamma proteobacterium endosymbiont of Lamellibrachia anaximandri]